MKVICISDTHCKLRQVNIPDGDILAHAGDLTFRGDINEIAQELHALEKLRSKFKHILLVFGNHDWLGQNNPSLAKQMCDDAGVTLLDHSEIVIDGIKFFGSAWQPEFYNWAYNLPRGQALKDKWDQIPSDTDVLITHTPPYGILDEVRRVEYIPAKPGGNPRVIERMEHVGCEELYKAVERVKPRYHVFGHIHSGYGKFHGGTIYLNASICTEEYKPLNKPLEFNL